MTPKRSHSMRQATIIMSHEFGKNDQENELR